MSVDGFGSGGVKSHGASTSIKLHDGLKDRSAKWPDKSTKLPGGPSVSKDATRSSVASTPKTLGPRVA
jgi:hypothetical protein